MNEELVGKAEQFLKEVRDQAFHRISPTAMFVRPLAW